MESMRRGFTLLELVIVIVILGILATLGFTQYSKQVETMRGAEARARLGTCIKGVYEYYLKNGDISTITGADVGISNSSSSSCVSSDYFYYYLIVDSGKVGIRARRCTAGGKNPQGTKDYIYRVDVEPASGLLEYYCWVDGVFSGPYTNWGNCAQF